MKRTLLRSDAWRVLRRLVLERDGYRCVVCKRDVSGPGKARVDHIKPRRTHPHLAMAISNLRTLCTGCDNQSHREKGGSGDNRAVNTGARQERFVIRGVNASGVPLDPNHHWNRS